MDIDTKESLENKSLYLKHIKNNCFICEIYFKNSWSHYRVFGNACTVCSARIVRVLYSGKQRRKSPITKEQANILIALRKKWVLETGKNLKINYRICRKNLRPEPDEYAIF